MRFSSLVTAIAFSALRLRRGFRARRRPADAELAARADAGAKAAKSAECYKQADVKTLHGKDRKKFHHECMKAQ